MIRRPSSYAAPERAKQLIEMNDSGGCNTAIVLVNWNGAADTVACLRSIQRLTIGSGELSVIVVDNASGDDSVGRIEAALRHDGYILRHSSLSKQEAERVTDERWFESKGQAAASVCVARARINGGFAAGNNIGYRIAVAVKQPTFVWHLNNDTEVTPQSLRLLVDKMQAEPDIGICGATLVFHDDSSLVQACGGVRYSAITGRGWAVAAGLPISSRPTSGQAEAQISYVAGASMFVRCSQIDKVGLMAEDYFLYSEEIDWAWRSRKAFRLGVEAAAIVIHKEGAAIGTERRGRGGSPLSNFFQTRSKLRFAWRHTPAFLPTVWLTLLGRSAKLASAGNASAAWVILQVLFGRREPAQEWFERPRTSLGSA